MAWLYTQAGSKYWWIGYRHNGKQYLKSTKTTSKEEAEKILATREAMLQAAHAKKLTKEFFHQIAGTENVHKTLKAAVGEWLAVCRGSTEQGTADRYTDVGNEFVAFLKADDSAPAIDEITPAEVQSFLNAKRVTCAVSTSNLYRTIVAMFFVWCVEQDYISKSPARMVKKFKESAREKKKRRPFTLVEIKDMMEKAPNPFWRYMVMGGYLTGLRLGDLACATWSNFDLESGWGKILTSKTGKTVPFPIASNLKNLLVALKRTAGRVKGSDYVWPDQAAKYQEKGASEFSNEFRVEILLPCGLVNKRTHKKQKDGPGRDGPRKAAVSFHCLRHSFVSTLKLTGAHQATAKELAGHASDEVNDLYATNPPEVLQAAIARLDDKLSE